MQGRFCRECGPHAGNEKEEHGRQEGTDEALNRCEERSGELVTVGPVELESSVPVGRVTATDESTAGGVLTKLVRSIRLESQAVLETAALTAPKPLGLGLPSA